MITVTLTNQRHIAAATAAYIATIPADPEATPPYASVESYVQAAIERVAESWADTTGVDRIPMADFVLRFDPAEIAAIKAAATAGNATCAGLIARLGQLTHVRLGSDETVAAFAYLVAAGLLTSERGAEVLHYDVPQAPA